jgi:serine/threonine protein phosphatase PrpC
MALVHPSDMKIRGWGVSDVGRRRDHNEDSFLCSETLSLFAVADGMGGHLGGERASRMAVDIVERTVTSKVASGTSGASTNGAQDLMATQPMGNILKTAIIDADRAIYENALADSSLTGMGTTLTALLFHQKRAHVGHVGDSRAYLYRDGKARQLTDDHSWIQDQVRAGLLSPEEAKESRFRNIITRSVGFEPSVRPDMQELTVQAGDCYLLCSDGLSNCVSLEEIGQVLTTQFYRDTPGALIAMANDRGGDDNITCVCVYAAND